MKRVIFLLVMGAALSASSAKLKEYQKGATPVDSWHHAMAKFGGGPGTADPWYSFGPVALSDAVPQFNEEWKKLPQPLTYPYGYRNAKLHKSALNGFNNYVRQLPALKVAQGECSWLLRQINSASARKQKLQFQLNGTLQATVFVNGEAGETLAESGWVSVALHEGKNELVVRLARPAAVKPAGKLDAKEARKQERLKAKSKKDRKRKSGPPILVEAFSPATVDKFAMELGAQIQRDFGGEASEQVVEYCRLQHEIAMAQLDDGHVQARRELLSEQVFRKDAMILPTDRDALDVVLRRTRKLMSDLGSKDWKKEFQTLEKATTTVVVDDPARWELFQETSNLRRKIAFSNPLLDFDRIVFLTHKLAKAGHMCDQYFGFHANPGGSLYVLENPFSEKPIVRDLLADSTVQNGRLKGRKLVDGSFIALDLSFDGKEVMFAWTQGEGSDMETLTETYKNDPWKASDRYKNYVWKPESTYHIFKANADGSNLTQLTDGPWNDFDPCYLPNGRIMFVSERRGGYGRCHPRPVPTYTLHGMMPDGSDIVPLSYHETNEWHPSVDNNGMIIYSRWDYVDRDDELHNLWLTSPDGRDPRAWHGSYPKFRELKPWNEMDPRAIPGSHKYIATASSHHGPAYGPLVVVDQKMVDDGAMSQVKRLTPETPFPEGEAKGVLEYGCAWPLSEDYYLCIHDPNGKNHGIYLIDSFGNRELIYRDPEIPCLNPMPLRPRKKPPVIPIRTTQALADRMPDDDPTSTCAIMNIYDTEFEWPPNTKITALRVVQLFPKTTVRSSQPKISAGGQTLARGVLGTAPVEEDGSVYLEVPFGIPIYFQALDERGLAVQTMRSNTFSHRGEQLVCQGCHENKHKAVTLKNSRPPIAFSRPASKLKKDVDGTWPVFYPVLVQEVLDRNCVECHQTEKKAPSLAGRDPGVKPKPKETMPHYASFTTLTKNCMYFSGGNGTIHNPPNRGGGTRSVAGKIGAYGSDLFHMLEKGHHNVKLSKEDMHRLTLWMDLNCVFYGDYQDTEKQYLGQVVIPGLE
ncbi:MAG: hypothetical protein K9M45_06850 [Kiritimatiellales bacterium]|nr:hypothetical protein [Kiritimatiellales bacterium]